MAFTGTIATENKDADGAVSEYLQKRILPVTPSPIYGDPSAGGRKALSTPMMGVKLPQRHCQTNLNPAKGAGPRRSGRQLTPLGQGGGTVLSEDVAAIEVTVLIEMIVD